MDVQSPEDMSIEEKINLNYMEDIFLVIIALEKYQIDSGHPRS